MRFNVVFRYIGMVLLLNSIFLFISTGVAVYYGDGAVPQLLFSALLCTLSGIIPLIFVPNTAEISNSEGMMIVVGSWMLACILGAAPYALWGREFTLSNALFESVSGFTTTGATVVSNIEALPHGILFWRASTHWIGGVGIIVFILSVLPSMGGASLVLYRSEMSPAALRQFKMRAKEAVRVIASVYVVLTFLETLALMICGLSLFDAITHSFATIATGGFSTKNLSVASFNNPAAEVVIMVFMFIAGMNFGLLFAITIGNFSAIKYSEVLKYYFFANIIGILIVAFDLYGSQYDSFIQSLRYASFQVLSLGTSTGFASADSSVWSPFAQMILIYFTLQCACAGSTSGGIKTDRIVILYKSIVRKIKHIIYPNAVFHISVDKIKVTDVALEMNLIYILLYLGIVFISTLFLTGFGLDVVSAFSGSAACMGNAGPGLGSVGSFENYKHLTHAGKVVLSIVMLLGRLEIYGILILFSKKMWK